VVSAWTTWAAGAMEMASKDFLRESMVDATDESRDISIDDSTRLGLN
jgi:hypothetical protein